MKVTSLFFKNNENGLGRSTDNSRAGASPIRTREEWLLRLVNALRPAFQKIGYRIPDQLRVTCGWPSRAALSRKRRTLGECWSSKASADQTTEIFISPSLGEAIEAAECLVHELIHAGGVIGHRGRFPAIAKAIGLRKPWRATHATPELRARLNALISGIGAYPHATLDVSMMPHKKDGTRMQKLICACCGYPVRTTEKWIRELGMPRCPRGTPMQRPVRIL